MTEITGLLTTFAKGCLPDSSGGFLGFPTWYKYLDSEVVAGRCGPLLIFPDDITKILLAVFEILLRVAGIAAVAFIIHGGIQYIVSQGDPDKVKGARQTIVHALVGMAIAISATAIVNLVARSIT